MKWKNTNLQTRLYLITAIILLVGMGSAISIYMTAENASDSVLIYEFEHSKKYKSNLEVIGGKWNVLVDQFCRWFEGLWHGRSLAFIVGSITVLVSCGFIFVAYHLSSDSRSDARDEDHRAGPSGTAK